MGKTAKGWLWAATALVFAGLILVAVSVSQWDLRNMDTGRYETNTHGLRGEVSDLCIETGTADVLFLVSEEETVQVVCQEESRAKHTVTLQDGVLRIQQIDQRKWYDHIRIGIFTPRITVSLPAGTYGSLLLGTNTGDVKLPNGFSFQDIDISGSTGDIQLFSSVSGDTKIQLSTGSVTVENTTVNNLTVSLSTGEVVLSEVSCEGDLSLRCSTGDTRLAEVRCKNLTSVGSTGDLTLKNTVVSGSLSLERSTGDITLKDCDGGQIHIETTTGNVEGTLLSQKVIFATTDTGAVNIPRSTTGGLCEITTDTGHIQISIT